MDYSLKQELKLKMEELINVHKQIQIKQKELEYLRQSNKRLTNVFHRY